MKIEAKNNLFFILICGICLFNGLTDAGYMDNINWLMNYLGRGAK